MNVCDQRNTFYINIITIFHSYYILLYLPIRKNFGQCIGKVLCNVKEPDEESEPEESEESKGISNKLKY
ncbi:hypothetical protein RhiirA4_467107 [Rhizophagus irregularis]|uniref:Uncharacterized protein n=1 Tax=Rhizophagus irregularis TaxID=588596 RepID=A0A2I1GVE8_9GLOM|nr:hypothetical protein RhiirA4_467107 [Rhizophagus irregularis]